MSNQIHALENNEIRTLAPSVFAGNASPDVSARYSFLPTITVVEKMRDVGWMPVKAQEQRIRLSDRRGFQKHTLRFQRAQDIASAGALRVLGQISAEIVMVNSHDRTSAYQLHAGLFRLACLNGMVVADSTLERVSITHVGFEPDAVIAASLRIAGEMPRVLDNVQAWRAHRLSPVERRAFAESAILLRYDDLKHAPVGAEKLLAPRRSEDAGENLWNTFNVVQENLTQGGQKDYGRRVPKGESEFATKRAPRSRAVAGIDANLKLNKALWHLAEVLKTGGNPAAALASN